MTILSPRPKSANSDSGPGDKVSSNPNRTLTHLTIVSPTRVRQQGLRSWGQGLRESKALLPLAHAYPRKVNDHLSPSMSSSRM